MDCNGFKRWLISRDDCEENLTRQAHKHREDCPDCNQLYTADEGLEQAFSNSMRMTPPPSGLARRARQRAEAEARPTGAKRPGWLWKGFAPALAIGLLLVVWNPWANPLTSLETIGNFALANHSRTDMTMAFTADEIPDPREWFYQRLNFRVAMPNFSQRQLTFLGGRECTIGPKKAAYLYYDDNGKRVSVFVMPARQIKFPLQAERRYRIDALQYSVELWKMDAMVCILVQERNPDTLSTT